MTPPPVLPKYDESKSVCGFRVCIVGFRGGARTTLFAGETPRESQCQGESEAATPVFAG